MTYDSYAGYDSYAYSTPNLVYSKLVFSEPCKIGTYDGYVVQEGDDKFCIIGTKTVFESPDQIKSTCEALGAKLVKPTSEKMTESIMSALFDQGFSGKVLLDATDEAVE